jgi:hypothetical protein
MEKMWNGTEYMSLVFKLDMCTCGGKAPEKIVSTRRCDGSFSVVSEFFFRKKREAERRNFNNSFVFPVECDEWSLGKNGARDIMKSLSLFDTDFPPHDDDDEESENFFFSGGTKNCLYKQKCVLSLYENIFFAT